MFDVISISHRTHRGIAAMPGPLESWRSRVPALSACAYEKAVSLILAPMPKSHLPYSPDACRQKVEFVRAGRSPKDLAGEFEPNAVDRQLVAQADKQEGRREKAVPGPGFDRR